MEEVRDIMVSEWTGTLIRDYTLERVIYLLAIYRLDIKGKTGEDF